MGKFETDFRDGLQFAHQSGVDTEFRNGLEFSHHKNKVGKLENDILLAHQNETICNNIHTVFRNALYFAHQVGEQVRDRLRKRSNDVVW